MASYRSAVEWIAYNDDEEVMDADDIAGFLTTSLVADIFAKDPRSVALYVVRLRKERQRASSPPVPTGLSNMFRGI